jgi:hypothetical protein
VHKNLPFVGSTQGIIPYYAGKTKNRVNVDSRDKFPFALPGKDFTKADGYAIILTAEAV